MKHADGQGRRCSSKFEAEAEKVEAQFDRGIITDDERRQKEIEIWTEATDAGPRGDAGRDAPGASSTPST